MITARRPDGSTITRNISFFRPIQHQNPPQTNPTEESDFDIPTNIDPPKAQDPNMQHAVPTPDRPHREIRPPQRLIETM